MRTQLSIKNELQNRVLPTFAKLSPCTKTASFADITSTEPTHTHKGESFSTPERALGNQTLLGLRKQISHSSTLNQSLPLPGSGWHGYLVDEEIGEAPPNADAIFLGQTDAGMADAEPIAPPGDAGPSAAPSAPAEAPAAPATAPPAPVPCTITNRATAHAPDGSTPDTRTTIGVCETIAFNVGQSADWSASNGWPGTRTGRATFQWAAPETPGTSTITATIPATGQTCTLDMTVIAPAELRMIKRTDLAFPAGSAGAGMTLEVRAHPRTVNFGWISLLESPGPASGVTGYFAGRVAAGADLGHHPNPGFVRFNFNNAICCDTAAAPPGALPAPWSAGSFHWNIPNRYRCSNSSGTGHFFTTTVQGFAITAAGAVTVTKQGQVVRRSP